MGFVRFTRKLPERDVPVLVNTEMVVWVQASFRSDGKASEGVTMLRMEDQTEVEVVGGFEEVAKALEGA
jgi:hypothetical protein